jgi:hypothetical protein
MANYLAIINYQLLNSEGQPIAGAQVAVLSGDLNGASNVTSTTQPGSPLATIYADPQASTSLANPTTPGSNTVTTDGYGNLCSIVDVEGVLTTTLGICVKYSTTSTVTSNYVLQFYGSGINGQLLVPFAFPYLQHGSGS